ncbi:MAG: hypothetical protein EOP86_22225 [Verrucomicrobiaceae bacterium]|nr:MAG: hypothetical protein EOP86_22225 [Verrucomicrobiaceae bacterium]
MDPSFPLLRNFYYWTFHVTLNAAPSFLILLNPGMMTPLQFLAIVCAVACFIVAYTFLTASLWFRRGAGSGLFGRAFRQATNARAVISGLAIMAMTTKLPLLAYVMAIELLAGMAACGIVTRLGRIGWVRELRIEMLGPDPVQRARSVWIGGMESFVPTFLTTLAEGVILSALMVGIALLIYAVLRLKHRRKTANAE